MHHMCHREVHSGGHYSYCYGQKINAVTQVSQQKTKVSKTVLKMYYVTRRVFYYNIQDNTK